MEQWMPMLQLGLIVAIGFVFLFIERLRPGRKVPLVRGWYARAILLNTIQFSLVFIAGATWNRWFDGQSILHLAGNLPSIVEGFLYWFIGTFIFYWWHRLRHENGWWLVFHQVHHSPTRIEVLTAFYKHPLEMIVGSILISAIIFLVFGGSIEAAAWYNVFAVTGEFFYHANLATPRWFGYFIQRPEQHSIHHERGVHQYNFGDITWWDRLFGTFKEADTFVSACGFEGGKEERLLDMLTFRDVNR